MTPTGSHLYSKHLLVTTFPTSILLGRTFLEEPIRISKVCSTPQQSMPRSPAKFAALISKVCRTLQQILPHIV
jgi:hypothetical protein